MHDPISRRVFASLGAGAVLAAQGEGKTEAVRPAEVAFDRDYPAPGFVPSWKKPQINRLLVQDFVIYAHSDPSMAEKLLAREPALINASIDWGAGDWETGLGGASHMGRRDIVQMLLKNGARLDIFCAAMMGLIDAVRAGLTLEPRLI